MAQKRKTNNEICRTFLQRQWEKEGWFTFCMMRDNSREVLFPFVRVKKNHLFFIDSKVARDLQTVFLPLPNLRD